MTKTTARPSSDQQLTERLRSGLRATSQRLVMHRLLRERNRHLSAEELLDEASSRLPGISLPTVYSTLELFEDLGIVRRVKDGGGRLLWDTRGDDHHTWSAGGAAGSRTSIPRSTWRGPALGQAHGIRS